MDIRGINQEVVDEILLGYVERCKIKHSLAFFKWRSEYQKVMNTNSLFESLSIRKERILKTDTQLFSNTDMLPFERKITIMEDLNSDSKSKNKYALNNTEDDDVSIISEEDIDDSQSEEHYTNSPSKVTGLEKDKHEIKTELAKNKIYTTNKSSAGSIFVQFKNQSE